VRFFSSSFNPSEIENHTYAIQTITAEAVRRVLAKPRWTRHDLPILLSPAATAFLSEMSHISTHLTRKRFGNTIQLFIPLYLSNRCYNRCAYCGFSVEHKYRRVTLSEEEILKEGRLLYEKGFRHILLLTGEAEDAVGVPYISRAVELLRPYFSSIGLEVQPLKTEEYAVLIQKGADSLTLYQETYHPQAYAKYHTAGKKKNYGNRLDAADRAGEAGFYRMTIGALLGLYEWRFEALAIAAHLDYLQKRYWRTQLGVSFNRIQKMIGEFSPDFDVTARDVEQLIVAFRLVYPDLLMTLSTREPASVRDRLMGIGVTAMSAESNTSPGGYSGVQAEKQFEISDERSLNAIVTVLKQNRLEPVFKDWCKEIAEVP